MDTKDFVFSQNSMQDYLDCPRRFELRHQLHQSWPAEETSDQAIFEEHLRQGNDLHRAIQQMVAGIPTETVEESLSDGEVRSWWASFRSNSSLLKPVWDTSTGTVRVAEHSLRGYIHNWRVTAKYDLLVVQPGKKLWIYDWKTSRTRADRGVMARKVQTRLYPLLAVRAGAHWNQGKAWEPEQIEMVYWLSSQPGEPLYFPYTSSQYQADHEYLDGLLEEISQLNVGDFPLTMDVSKCRFCVYRSLCDRGIEAGLQSDYDLIDPIGLDLSNLSEGEY